MTLEVNETLLGFDEIANLMVAEEAMSVSPSELHGLLAGQLASGARLTPDAWLASAADLLDMASGFTHEESKAGLVALYEQTLGQFESDSLGFALLQPDDDASLSQRVSSLGSWCQGFIAGFGYQGKQTDQTLSDEAKDALNDLSQIAQVEAEVEEDDSAEGDLYELQEYVRMAALMMFTECNMPADTDGQAQKEPPVIH